MSGHNKGMLGPDAWYDNPLEPGDSVAITVEGLGRSGAGVT